MNFVLEYNFKSVPKVMLFPPRTLYIRMYIHVNCEIIAGRYIRYIWWWGGAARLSLILPVSSMTVSLPVSVTQDSSSASSLHKANNSYYSHHTTFISHTYYYTILTQNEIHYQHGPHTSLGVTIWEVDQKGIDVGPPSRCLDASYNFLQLFQHSRS